MTQRPDPRELARLLRTELAKHLQVDAVIESFGQVAAARHREAGGRFSLRDHVRGMVLAMLSANRPWRPIADNLEDLGQVFGNYEPAFLEQVAAHTLVGAVRDLRCGNRRLSFQLEAIRPNLMTMRRVEAQSGSMDAFVTAEHAEQVAERLGGAGSPWKLREFGPVLALEYLKNVGVRAVKPDVHVLRICGPERLGILASGMAAAEASRHMAEFARAAGLHPVELDNMIWLLGAKDYAEICTASPACGRCDLRQICSYPRDRAFHGTNHVR